jgi:hypothetical protein
MPTETKTRHLLPGVHEDPELVRDNYYGNWPPKTNGDLPGWSPSAHNAEESRAQAERVRVTRSKERNLVLRKTAAYLGILAALGIPVGAVAYGKMTEPNTRTVEMPVKPYDNPSTVAQRAETRFGKDPADFNIQEEALRLAAKYGVLHAGEHLKVHVK